MLLRMRHSAIVRLTHWINVLSFIGLLVSGIAILLVHPRLYWGETGSVQTPSLLDLPLPFVFNNQNGWGRSLHFLSAWVSIANGMLYVWVYSHDQEHATPLRCVLIVIESGVRPVLSRLPGFWQTLFLASALLFYVLYQNFHRRTQLGAHVAAWYGWNEALHAARDRLTPPFAHRHTYEEVIEWFHAEMYQGLELLRDEQSLEGVPDTFPLNVGVRGFRRPVRSCDSV